MHEVAFPDRAPARARKAATGKAKPRGAASSASKGGLWRRARLPALTSIATAGLAAILAGIVLNALVLQKGHHPAPLFGSEAPPPPSIRPASPPHPLAGAPAPAGERVAEPMPDMVLPKTVPPLPHDQPSTHVGTAKPRDRIAQLLDGTLEPAGRSAAGDRAKPAQLSARQGHHPVATTKAAGTARPSKARDPEAGEMKTDLARAGQPFAADRGTTR